MRLCRSCTVKLLLTSLLSVYAISFLVLFFFSSDLVSSIHNRHNLSLSQTLQTTTDNCNYSQKLVKEKTKQVVFIPFDGYDVPGEVRISSAHQQYLFNFVARIFCLHTRLVLIS